MPLTPRMEAERLKLEEKVKRWHASIAWAEANLIEARAWEAAHGFTYASPGDWECLVSEFRHELYNAERRVKRYARVELPFKAGHI